jgi:hypothetical protein
MERDWRMSIFWIAESRDGLCSRKVQFQSLGLSLVINDYNDYGSKFVFHQNILLSYLIL